MEFRASARFQPVSARKTRLVVDLLRGLPVNRALDTLRLCRLRGSRFVDKLLRSALAAAAEQQDADADSLYVRRIWVNEGPMRYGRLPRLRGTWTRIRSRSSHIHVVLAEREAEGTAEREAAEDGQKPGRKRK